MSTLTEKEMEEADEREKVCAAVLTTLASGRLSYGMPPGEFPDTALSILVGASSPGPDPLALKSLGWAYGNGAGGGMGDYGGCHYMPGNIGETLESLQESVSLKLAGPNNGAVPNPHIKARFCTVGGLPPYTEPYDGVIWDPSIAGICVPAACDANSLYNLFGKENFIADLTRLSLSSNGNNSNNSDNNPDIYSLSRRHDYVRALTQSLTTGRLFRQGVICEGETGLPELDENYRGFGYYSTVSLIAVLSISVVIGTLLNSFQSKNPSITEAATTAATTTTEESPSPENKNQSHLPTNNASTQNLENGNHNENHSHSFSSLQRALCYVANKFQHFDAQKNINAITYTSKRNIQFFHGLRAISMLWIILGHTLVVQSSVGYQNPSAVLPPSGMIASRWAMIFFSARYSVDTFFFLSGFLVMRSLLYRFQQQNNMQKYWVVPFLLRRALRLLPTYAFVLLLWWKLAVTLGEGPFWPRWATFVAQCDAHAWTNMLFINNIVPFNQPLGESSECMYHTWYLGVDFQLCAILAPIFFCIFQSSKPKAFLVQGTTILTIIIVSFISSFLLDWSGHLFDGRQTVSFDRGYYIQPFFRATPYIVGTMTAQLWQQKCQHYPNTQMRYPRLLSILSIGTLIYLTFLGVSAYENRPCLIWEDTHVSQCGSGWTSLELAFYNSLVRPAWSLALAVLSLLALNGQLIQYAMTVLNWPGWTFISNLSFAMYLLHPLIINIWYLSRTSKFYYSHIEFTYGFAAVVSITYFAALITGLLVEYPMSKIIFSLLTKKVSTTSSTTTTNTAASSTTKSEDDKESLEIPLVVDEEQRLLLSSDTTKEKYTS